MPREFQDFSQEVFQGSDKIRQSLESVRNAADKADASSVKLSNTQDNATRVADSYSRVMAGVSGELASMNRSGLEASRGLSIVESSVRTLGSSLSSIRDGSKEAVLGFEGINKAALEASKSIDNISGQEVKILFNVESALSLKKELVSVQSMAEQTSNVFNNAKTNKGFNDSIVESQNKIQELGNNIESLGDNSIEIDIGLSSVDNAEKTVAGLEKRINLLRKEIEELHQETSKEVVLEETMRQLTKSIKSTQAEILRMEGSFDKINKKEYLDANINLSSLREVSEYLESLDDSQKTLIEAAAKAGNLSQEIEQLIKDEELLAAKIQKSNKETIESITACKTYTGEIEKATSVLDLLNNELVRGQKEGKEFANGLGVSNGKLIGAGVGVYLLSQKLTELLDNFKNTRLELGRFNVELALLESRSVGFGLSGSFKDLRNELSLTRAQSKEFFDTFTDGVQSGVVSATELAFAASQIREAFGGDPTENLKRYVDLLKEIPTLETDLSITASLDDKAASVFALARAGKVQAMIDLQSTGLLGGIKEGMSKEDVELINASQKTEKTVESIHDFLQSKLFPKWGPQFSAISEGTFKIVGFVSKMAVGMGMANVLLGKQLLTQQATLLTLTTKGRMPRIPRLPRRESMIPGRTSGGGFLFYMKRTFGKLLKSTPTNTVSTGTNLATNTVQAGKLAKAGSLVTKGFVSLFKTANVAVLAVNGLGYAGRGLAKSFDNSGKEISSAATSLTSELLVAAGTIGAFTLLGSKVPVIGTALGFLAGTVIAASSSMEHIGVAATRLGKGLQGTTSDGSQKYTDGTVKFGAFLERYGAKLESAGNDFSNYLKEAGHGVSIYAKEFGSAILEAGMAVHPLVFSYRQAQKKIDSLKTDEYRKELKAAEMSIHWMNVRMETLSKVSASYQKVLYENQKKMQLSALSLERQLAATKAAFNSGKIEILNFSAELASLGLENITSIGGTMEGFNNAVKNSASTLRKRFNEVGNALNQRRVDILKDSRMSASDRKSALMDLKQKELEATKMFVDGINKTIEALYNSPALIQAGLKREMASKPLDYGLETGSVSFDEFIKNLNTQLSAVFEEQLATTEAAKKAELLATGMENDVKEARKTFKQKFLDSLSDMPADLRQVYSQNFMSTNGGEVEIDQSQLDNAISLGKKASDELTQRMDEISATLPIAAFNSLAGTLRDVGSKSSAVNRALEEAKKELEKAKENLQRDGSEKNLSKVYELQEKVEGLSERSATYSQQLQPQKEGFVGAIKNQLGNEMDSEDIFKIVDFISEQLSQGKVNTVNDLGNLTGSIEGINKVINAITNMESDGVEAYKRFQDLQTQQNVVSRSNELLEGLSNEESANTAAQKARVDAVAKQFDSAKQVNETLAKASEFENTDSIRALKRRLEAIKAQESLSGITNDSVSQMVEAQTAQIEYFTQYRKGAEDSVRLLLQTQKNLEEQLKGMKESDIAYSQTLGQIKTTKDLITKFRSGVETLAQEMGRVGDSYEKVIDVISKSTRGRILEANSKLGELSYELAGFSQNYLGAIEKAAEATRRSASAMYNEEMSQIGKAREVDMRQIDMEVERVRQTTGSNESAEKARVDLTNLANLKYEEASISARKRYSDKMLDNAKKEYELRENSLNSQKEVIEAEIDFISEMGGSMDKLIDKQRESVLIEAQRLKNAQDKAKEIERTFGKGSEEAKQANRDAYRQRLEHEKKIMGIQKSVYEQFAGMAFGQLDGNRGAFRNRDAHSQIMGRDNTRMMGRGGIYLQGKNDDVKSISEREADRRAAMINSQFGGVAGAGVDLLNDAPERLDIEKQIASSGKDTAKNTADIVNLLKTHNSGISPQEDINTNDINTEAIEQRNRIMNPIASSYPSVQVVDSHSDGSMRDYSDEDVDRYARDINNQASPIQSVPSGSNAPTQEVQNSHVNSEYQNKSEPLAIKLMGEIQISTNKMFDAQFKTMVAQAMSSADVRTALMNQGFLNSN